MSQDSKDQSRIEAETIAVSLSKGSTFLYFGKFLFYIIGFINVLGACISIHVAVVTEKR